MGHFQGMLLNVAVGFAGLEDPRPHLADYLSRRQRISLRIQIIEVRNYRGLPPFVALNDSKKLEQRRESLIGGRSDESIFQPFHFAIF